MKNTFILFASLLLTSLAHADLNLRGTGTATGTIAVIFEPKEILLKKLPAVLKLDERFIFPDGTYPVVLFMGEQTNLQSHTPAGSVLVEKKYREVTYTFTVVGPNKKNYTYTSNIIVDSVPSMLMGWALGYPKKLREMSHSSTSLDAHSLSKLSVKAAFEDIGSYDREQFIQNFNFLFATVPQTVSRNALGFQCFDFIWSFEESSLKPTRAVIELGSDFTTAEIKTHTSEGLNSTAFGAFKFRSGWEIKNIKKCDFE